MRVVIKVFGEILRNSVPIVIYGNWLEAFAHALAYMQAACKVHYARIKWHKEVRIEQPSCIFEIHRLPSTTLMESLQSEYHPMKIARLFSRLTDLLNRYERYSCNAPLFF